MSQIIFQSDQIQTAFCDMIKASNSSHQDISIFDAQSKAPNVQSDANWERLNTLVLLHNEKHK